MAVIYSALLAQGAFPSTRVFNGTFGICVLTSGRRRRKAGRARAAALNIGEGKRKMGGEESQCYSRQTRRVVGLNSDGRSDGAPWTGPRPEPVLTDMKEQDAFS